MIFSSIVTPDISLAEAPIFDSNNATHIVANSIQKLSFTGFSNQTTPILPSVNSTCINQVEKQADTINAVLDTTKAISLTHGSGTFASKLQGYNSKFNSIFDTWSFDKNCNLTMKTVNVVYSLYNATGGFVKNIVVTEDPGLTKINNMTEQKVPSFIINNIWSGYEVYGSATGQTDPIYKTQSIWTVPSVSDPFFGACLPACELGIWTGLTSGANGLLPNGTNAIVQTGTDSCVTDSTGCNNGAIWAWYQFYTTNVSSNSPPVKCYSLNANDQVSVDVINEAINTGGDPTKYDIHNVDTTTGLMCTPIVGHKFVTGLLPYYAQYINEIQPNENIPKFGSDTMIGYLWDQAQGFQSISIPYSNGFYNAYNLGTLHNQNINFGSASTGSFIQFWSPNCSPPGTGTSWTVQTSCTLVSNYAAGANIEVWPGSILTVASGTKLMTDLTQNKITVDNNGGLLIEGGGQISKN